MNMVAPIMTLNNSARLWNKQVIDQADHIETDACGQHKQDLVSSILSGLIQGNHICLRFDHEAHSLQAV